MNSAKCHSVALAAVCLPLYKWIPLFWTDSCCAINSIRTSRSTTNTSSFSLWLLVGEKVSEKKNWLNFSYCCCQIILVSVLRSISGTIFFLYLHNPLALLFADLALFERIIVSCESCQSGSQVAHVCYRVSSCLTQWSFVLMLLLNLWCFWWWYSSLHWTCMQSGSVICSLCTSNTQKNILLRKFQILTINI